MAIDLGIAVSPAASTSSQATANQNDGTFINFGSGFLEAPTDTQLNPNLTSTPTATASATAGTPASGTSALATYAPWIIAGAAVLVLVAVLLVHDVKRA